MFQISLCAARVNANLSQKDVAKSINVNRATVSNWERGLTSPDADKLKELCNLYKCPVGIIILERESTGS